MSPPAEDASRISQGLLTPHTAPGRVQSASQEPQSIFKPRKYAAPLYTAQAPTVVRCAGYQEANRSFVLRIFRDCTHKHHYL